MPSFGRTESTCEHNGNQFQPENHTTFFFFEYSKVSDTSNFLDGGGTQ